MRDTQFKVRQQYAEFAKHLADMLMPNLLTLFCDGEVTDDILRRPLHLYRRTFDTFYLRHAMNGRVQYIKKILSICQNRVFIIVRLVTARFLVFVHC